METPANTLLTEELVIRFGATLETLLVKMMTKAKAAAASSHQEPLKVWQSALDCIRSQWSPEQFAAAAADLLTDPVHAEATQARVKRAVITAATSGRDPSLQVVAETITTQNFFTEVLRALTNVPAVRAGVLTPTEFKAAMRQSVALAASIVADKHVSLAKNSGEEILAMHFPSVAKAPSKAPTKVPSKVSVVPSRVEALPSPSLVAAASSSANQGSVYHVLPEDSVSCIGTSLGRRVQQMQTDFVPVADSAHCAIHCATVVGSKAPDVSAVGCGPASKAASKVGSSGGKPV